MRKKTWDLYAPIYKRAMQADHKTYEFMYDRIPELVRDKEVLELATGPGLLAKHVAPAAKRMIATDYSDGMIAEAKKGDRPKNLSFEIADAMNLPYEIVPAMCRLDYAMTEAGGASLFVREYTLASGGSYCDCGYKKKVRT